LNSVALAKLDTKRLSAFLADPGETRVVLLHGEDAGLARELADTLTRNITGGDDMCVIDVAKDAWRDAGLLAAEAATMALLGGRRVLRVRDAGDGFAAAAKNALEGPGPGLVARARARPVGGPRARHRHVHARGAHRARGQVHGIARCLPVREQEHQALRYTPESRRGDPLGGGARS
jgi:hypothetical protein